MFEIHNSRKIINSDKKSDNTTQQRAFLNEPQDSLELSTHKKKKTLNFGAAIHDALNNFLGNNDSISPKAVKILKLNNIVDDNFEPETSIIANENNFTDMPTAFQRKLAIDMHKGEPNKKDLLHNGLDTNVITYNDEGKIEKIEYYEGHQLKTSEEFEYAHKQDGSAVLIKQKIYSHDNDNKTMENEIKFHKHHNGAVTISSTDGRYMSYSLRKDSIRDYHNTPIIKPPVKSTQETTDTKPKVKLFKKPVVNYPTGVYSYSQLRTIDNKFEGLKREFGKYHNPNDEYAFASYKPVIEDLNKIKSLVLNVKDPKIQDEIIKHLSAMKDSDLDTEYIGNFRHVKVDVYNSYRNDFALVYKLAQLSTLLEPDAIQINDRHKCFANFDKNYISSYNNNDGLDYDTIDEINQEIYAIYANTTLSKEEQESLIQELLHKNTLEVLSRKIDTISHKKPELKQYLSDTYIKPNLPKEQVEDLNKIEKVTNEIIFPRKSSTFTFESLENFSKLSDTAKEHFLKHPNMCRNIYLYGDSNFGKETPYEALASLTPEEWEIFEARNIADILDVVTGFNINDMFKEKTGENIHNVLNMSNEEWEKINNFGLLTHGIKGDELDFEKHRNLTFDFDDMQTIVKDLSYKDWDTAKKRGLLTMGINDNDKSLLLGYKTLYDRNMGLPLFIATAKVPDSTFNYLKNIGLFSDNKIFLRPKDRDYYAFADMENVAKGIEFLSNSHNDVYENVSKLVNKGINAPYAMEVVGVCAKNYGRFGKYLTEKTLELSEHYNETKLAKALPPYLDFQSVKNKSDINELTIEEKRTLLKNVIKYNAELFDGEKALHLGNVLNSPIIPTNKEEYCALLPKLIKSIGIDTRPITQETIDNFESSIKNMAEDSSEFLNTKITKDNFNLDLEYSRKDFIKDIQENVAELSDSEKLKVYDYFGFDLILDRNNNTQMHGYPINVNNGKKLADIKDEHTKEIIEKVRPLVDKFSTNNPVNIAGKPELTKNINNILELFPEFRTTIGKEQHGTHDFTVDVHTLKVLQGVMSDPQYKRLPEKDKKLLSIATILHDLTKAEKMVDKTHGAYSAYDSYHLVNKMNLSEQDRTKIYQIIKNHEWLAEYNGKVKIGPNQYREKTPTEKDKAAKDIAFELKDENNFQLAKILTKADMKAVKETDYFFDKYEHAYNEAIAKIDPLTDNLQKTAIHLPQTKLPKASELIVDGENVREITLTNKYGNPVKDNNGNEITNKVVFLKPDMDLGKLGFEKGLNSNDLNVIVHALDYDNQSTTFQALGSIDSDSLLSASYVNYEKGNYHVFRQQGFILDVNSSDIQAGTYKDFGSGYGKDLETLKSEYLFNGNRKEIRNFMSNTFKKKMKLSDEEYKKLYPEIADKSITELDKTHPNVAKAIREIFMEMEIHKRKYNRDYNEWLISRPKIQGVFLQSSKYRYGEVPEFLAKYAADNDLPIIYFGE